MAISAERMDFLASKAAQSAGLAGAAELERQEELYQRWAGTPLPDLGGASPREYAAGLPPEELLRAFDESANLRKTLPGRLWLEEVVTRLRAELSRADTVTDSHLEDLPVLRAVVDRSLAEPEWELENVAVTVGALTALGETGDPRVIPWLLAGLATGHPEIREAAAQSLGRMGTDALPGITEALRRTRDPHLKEGLYTALGCLPREAPVREAIAEAWQEASHPERIALARAIGRHGDPALAPLVADELTAGTANRAEYATLAAALHRLGAKRPNVPAPPPAETDPEGDLLEGTRTLVEAGVQDLGRQWVQEALDLLERKEREDPGAVDWYVYEHIQRLADTLLERPAEATLARYLDYCFGALHFYGALTLEHLVAAVSLAGLMAPPDTETLWQAIKADPRFTVHTGRIVALRDVDKVEEILAHREELGIGPAIIPLRAMALTARGLAHLAWDSNEEEAAEELLRLLPEELATRERIAELQRAMRGQSEALTAFRQWLQQALAGGMEPGKRLTEAMMKLWNHTARWELFGHSPFKAQEILELQRAQEGEGLEEYLQQVALKARLKKRQPQQ
ncbi:MAG: HEAT repeat domain-containing protein [Firmicutes bacterium]|nr:HEAT repeat domain-containing protein [Bacillota bacterium]